MSNVFGFVPSEGGLTKKQLADLVTLDTAQSIEGEKTFTSDVICEQDIVTDAVVFTDGTVQSTAYTALTPGTYTNVSLKVDAFGSISSVATGSVTNFITTNTAQTITANKTFSGNVTMSNYASFGSQINYSYGGVLTAATATLTAPLFSIYTVESTTTTIVIPDLNPSLVGVRVMFKKTAGTFPGNINIRTLTTQGVLIPYNSVAVNSTVGWITSHWQCEIIYTDTRILQLNIQ